MLNVEPTTRREEVEQVSGRFECSDVFTEKATSHDETLDLPEDACCVECGYSLYGLVTARCPECGRAFNPHDHACYYRRIRRGLGRLENLVVSGVAVLFIFLLMLVLFSSRSSIPDTVSLAKSQIGRNGMMGQALRYYKHDTGKYPTTLDGLSVLFKAPDGGAKGWRGPYLEGTLAELCDPWGNSFRYVSPGIVNTNGYDLWSWGPDEVDDKGAPGSDDIKNWNP